MQKVYKMWLEEWVGFTVQNENMENNDFWTISRNTTAEANEQTLLGLKYT